MKKLLLVLLLAISIIVNVSTPVQDFGKVEELTPTPSIIKSNYI